MPPWCALYSLYLSPGVHSTHSTCHLVCTLLTLLVTWCALYSLYLSPGVQVADGVGNLDHALSLARSLALSLTQSLYLSPGVQVADGVGNLDDALHAFDGACRTVAPDDDGAFA